MRSPSLTPGSPAQGSNAKKISPHNFWLQKLVGIELVGGTSGAPSSLSKRTHSWTHRENRVSQALSLGLISSIPVALRMDPHAQNHALLYNILAPSWICVHSVYKGAGASYSAIPSLWHVQIAPPLNKGMSGILTALQIFFCLPKSQVNLPGLERLQHTHLHRLTACEFQHQDSSLKTTSGIQAGTEVSGIKVSRGHCPFSKPSPKRATEPLSWNHTRDTIILANTV